MTSGQAISVDRLDWLAVLVPVGLGAVTEVECQLAELERRGAVVHRLIRSSNVHHARNVLLARWLASGERWALWVDSDVEAIAYDGAAGEDPSALGADAWATFAVAATRAPGIVAGAYAIKRRGSQALACCVQAPELRLGQGGVRVPIDWVGFGAVLTPRAAVVQMARHLARQRDPRAACAYQLPDGTEAYGPRLFGGGQHVDPSRAPGPAWDEWTRELGVPWPRERWVEDGEDVGFCALAHQAGVPIELDPRLRLDHWGLVPFRWEDAFVESPARAGTIRVAQVGLGQATARRENAAQ